MGNLLIISGVLCALASGFASYRLSDTMSSDGWLLIAIPAGLAAVVLLLIPPGTAIGVHYDKINCQKFGENSGYPTKFTRYTFWSWECFAKTKNGKWIPSSQLRDIND